MYMTAAYTKLFAQQRQKTYKFNQFGEGGGVT